ncbi:hypothetical protein SAMN04487904_10910 [Actinopolyspora lacussalsi subsp. righensis]|uniref:Uncharacterized protein n=1 Tax=Actinopolyspora righensis TaxID=995060 RepID=A0A1I7B1B1_9ACTN|nr:hypothetical protein SAMN04487904_10910 [Actinopolyspora righensis]
MSEIFHVVVLMVFVVSRLLFSEVISWCRLFVLGDPCNRADSSG